MICGKTLAHWFFNQSNEIYGGFPTTLDNIKTEPDFMNFFVSYLFFHKTHITHKTKFKRILAATVLIFRDAFLGIIGNESSGKYKYPNHHPFHHKIISVLVETKISIGTFHKYQDEVIGGFQQNNWLAVDVSKFGQGSAKNYVDSRCVVRVIDEQVEVIGRLHQTIQNVTKKKNIMSNTMGGMVQDLHIIGK